MQPSSFALSRRHFLQGLSAAAAAAALPRSARAGVSDEIFDGGNPAIPTGVVGDPERVIVVGAGFAGLAAANALANAGVDVIVIEARNRIGGRAKTRDISGIPVDQGCSWIHGPEENPLTQWAQQLGVGATTAEFADDIATFTAYDALTGPINPVELVNVFVQTVIFDGQLSLVHEALGRGKTVGDAIAFFVDGLGLEGNDRRRVDAVLRYVNESGLAASVDDYSLDSFFDPVSNPNPDLNAYDGKDVFPVGGYRALYEPLAAGLDVRHGHRVIEVETTADGVAVRTRVKSGKRRRTREFRGSHVLITLPIGVLKAQRVHFKPLLPIPKVRAIQRMGVGYLEKISIGFDEPFWREGGKTHLFYGSETLGEFPAFLDLQQLSGGPVLQCFVAGDFGRRMSQMTRRR